MAGWVSTFLNRFLKKTGLGGDKNGERVQRSRPVGSDRPGWRRLDLRFTTTTSIVCFIRVVAVIFVIDDTTADEKGEWLVLDFDDPAEVFAQNARGRYAVVRKLIAQVLSESLAPQVGIDRFGILVLILRERGGFECDARVHSRRLRSPLRSFMLLTSEDRSIDRSMLVAELFETVHAGVDHVEAGSVAEADRLVVAESDTGNGGDVVSAEQFFGQVQ